MGSFWHMTLKEMLYRSVPEVYACGKIIQFNVQVDEMPPSNIFTVRNGRPTLQIDQKIAFLTSLAVAGELGQSGQ